MWWYGEEEVFAVMVLFVRLNSRII
jgi:hypothetical protein